MKNKNRNIMNNLLKILASAIGFFVFMIVPVACGSEEEPESTSDFTFPGKVFVNSYFNNADGSHEAGSEILEFLSDGYVVKSTLFCILAGDYLQLLDCQETGRYTNMGDDAVMYIWEDEMEVATLSDIDGKMEIHMPEYGVFECSDLTSEGIITQFKRVHKHDMLDPMVKTGDSLVTVSKDSRYFICSNRRSLVINIDSVSGSHANNNQVVSFRIAGIPGDFCMSEASGSIYLMRFGTMGYAPVDKDLAETNPENVVAILVCDGSTPNYTLASPSLIKNFQGGKDTHTRFAKLKPLLY